MCLADLLAAATITRKSNDLLDEDVKPRVENHLLRYDGNSYAKGKVSPWWLGY